MARAAIGQAAARIDVILPNELCALRELVGRRVPVHVVNFRARPDEILRLCGDIPDTTSCKASASDT